MFTTASATRAVVSSLLALGAPLTFGSCSSGSATDQAKTSSPESATATDANGAATRAELQGQLNEIKANIERRKAGEAAGTAAASAAATPTASAASSEQPQANTQLTPAGNKRPEDMSWEELRAISNDISGTGQQANEATRSATRAAADKL